MATLAYGDILKRDNISVLTKRINGEGGFQLETAEAPVMKATGKAIISMNGQTSFFDRNLSEGSLSSFLNTRAGSDYLDVELKNNGNGNAYYRITKLYKDKEFGGVAAKASGQGSERQELGLIQALNEAAAMSNKAYVSQIGATAYILNASKNEGLAPTGQEPYIDVFIETSKGKYGISCKGTSAPSLAGGGVAGLKVTAPELLRKLYTTIEYHLKTDLKLKSGDVVAADSIPDLFVKIPQNYVELILKGNRQMGGPIDYMYVGPMDVESTMRGNTVALNGNFYGIQEYMRKIGTFYFRVRKRDLEPSNTIAIELTRTNKEGYKMMFRGPKTNKNNLRLVITDKVPSTGRVLTLR